MVDMHDCWQYYPARRMTVGLYTALAINMCFALQLVKLTRPFENQTVHTILKGYKQFGSTSRLVCNAGKFA